jgi:hypothetical protein
MKMMQRKISNTVVNDYWLVNYGRTILVHLGDKA